MKISYYLLDYQIAKNEKLEIVKTSKLQYARHTTDENGLMKMIYNKRAVWHKLLNFSSLSHRRETGDTLPS